MDHLYLKRQVEGFQIHHKADVLSPVFWDTITGDLKEVVRLMPPKVLKVMQTARIYVNTTYYYGSTKANGACVHWSA